MISRTHAAATGLVLCALMIFSHPESTTTGLNDAGVRTSSALNLAHPILQSDLVVPPAAFLAFAPQPGDSCSDSIANCRDPVKYLGSQNGCACFACEYATSTQHNICTRNTADRDTLFRRAR